MNTKQKRQAKKLPKVKDGYKIVAMTISWPGSWGAGDSIKDAKKRLRQEESLTGKSVVYYLCHKDTSINDMGMFTHPEGSPPICLGE
jgi:hypothetical protein